MSGFCPRIPCRGRCGGSKPDLRGDLGAQKAGRRLVGIGGVGCIACHNFEGHPSLGIPIRDLTVMTNASRRAGSAITSSIRRACARHAHAQLLAQGKALNRDIRKVIPTGRSPHYGPTCPKANPPICPMVSFVPNGPNRGKQAVIYRNHRESARAPSASGIRKANLAFDADDMAIALDPQGGSSTPASIAPAAAWEQPRLLGTIFLRFPRYCPSPGFPAPMRHGPRLPARARGTASAVMIWTMCLSAIYLRLE